MTNVRLEAHLSIALLSTVEVGGLTLDFCLERGR